MTWRGEPDGITGTSNVTYVCPPDAYQHEPNAPAHRHHDRCQRIEPFVDEEPAAAQIARLKAANAELVNALEGTMCGHCGVRMLCQHDIGCLDCRRGRAVLRRALEAKC